ncbi:MAG TPA: S-adenosylmethionine:tRNA ribosyltransferase-isomerase [Planctomycetota bacterium]|nr:S-adenosylmethionine:tRNA ribosyltransferase-isomerase [Planctomycetota bacterium]
MSPAKAPRDDPRTTRLVVLDAGSGGLRVGSIGDLAVLLRPGDVLVLNDAATLPASLPGRGPWGAPVELRLAGEGADGTFAAIVFGAGDWRQRTEDRRPPPPLRAGDLLEFAALQATVVAVDPASPRLVTVRFDCAGSALWAGLYASGRPVQYSYLAEPLALWDAQTPFAGRPWAVESPSAGFALSWELLLSLRRRGVAFARVTHAAGLSSTGDRALDARLPFAERSEVPAATAAAVRAARERGGRVVAVGTTVVRALEAAARAGGLERSRDWSGTTDLRLGSDTPRRVVDAILTGLHEEGTSHFTLLEAFAPRALLRRANELAEQSGFLAHEFGDVALVLGAGAPVQR